MAALTLSGLYVYPIKSAAGIAVQEAQMTARGLRYDRRWMVVDAKGKFITQRTFPRMALISVVISESLVISAPGMGELTVSLASASAERVPVEVWGDECSAVAVGDESKVWFTQFLGSECQLVYMPDDSRRPAEHGKFGPNELVSFADAFPYLLISEASLAGLNKRLVEKGEAAVTMARFRPNLVVKGCEAAHAEDEWWQIKVGEAVLDLPKLCARCSIPGVNPQKGEQGKEPTKALAKYRYWDGGIWFGQNCVQVNGAQEDVQLRVGDAVEVLKEKP